MFWNEKEMIEFRTRATVYTDNINLLHNAEKQSISPFFRRKVTQKIETQKIFHSLLRLDERLKDFRSKPKSAGKALN